jgi:N-acetyl sugar amidotransferase
MNIDAQGICDACRFAEMKDNIVDWDQREAQLKELLERYRSRNGSYDCLVPGSGGKDSIYASHILKHKYGMNPLTVTWAPHLHTDVGWRNFQNWIHITGLDNFLFTPDGLVHRKLTELAYRNLLHPFQPFIIGQKNFAPKMAARFGIPLVFYGENEAEYGNPILENNNSRRGLEYFAYADSKTTNMFFGGVELNELAKHGISLGQMDPYLPISVKEMESSNIDVHYLGYYLKWIPQECYYYSVEHASFEANQERTEGTYSKYNSIDDKTDGFHYWTTYIKFGLGRASYDAAQEVRNHHIDRDEAVALVNRYDGEFPKKYFNDFLKYISMEESEFKDIADSFRSAHLWRRTKNEWELRHKVTYLEQK